MTTLNYAQSACAALAEAMAADERVVVLGEDVGRGGVFGQYRSRTGSTNSASSGASSGRTK